MKKILHRNNLNEAFKKVKSKKGTAGIDVITTEELLEYLKENKEKILGQIRARKYKPKPVKRVQIPKSNGKKRNLCKCQAKNGPQLLSKSGPHIVKILTTLVLSPMGNAFYIYFIYSLTTPLYLPSYNFFL